MLRLAITWVSHMVLIVVVVVGATGLIRRHEQVTALTEAIHQLNAQAVPPATAGDEYSAIESRVAFLSCSLEQGLRFWVYFCLLCGGLIVQPLLSRFLPFKRLEAEIGPPEGPDSIGCGSDVAPKEDR